MSKPPHKITPKRWVETELEDSLDEELEMELDDLRGLKEIPVELFDPIFESSIDPIYRGATRLNSEFSNLWMEPIRDRDMLYWKTISEVLSAEWREDSRSCC